jgi:hypothetical protein
MTRFLKLRPVVRRASTTHHQIRRFSGDGRYLVWPDGRSTPHTAPLATTYEFERAVEHAKRSAR